MMKTDRRGLVPLVLLWVALTALGCDQIRNQSQPTQVAGAASPTTATGPLTDGAEIIKRAQAATLNPPFHSLILTYTVRTSDGGVSDQGRLWYEVPSRWRAESKYRLVADAGPSPLQVSDGASLWNYDPTGNYVSISDLSGSGSSGSPPPYPLASAASTFKLNDCPAPQLLGSDTVAGRPTYKLALGPANCVAATSLRGDSWIVWIDQQTFLELSEQASYSSAAGNAGATPAQQSTSREVTDISYDVAIGPTKFSFTPPASARVHDERAVSLTEARKRVGFLVFVPTDVPARLRPEPALLRDRDSAMPRVDILYHTEDGQTPLEVSNSGVDPKASAFAKRGEAVKLASGATGYFSRIAPECNSGEGALYLYWEQQGTAITLRTPQYASAGGAQLSRDELISIAAGVSSSADPPTAPRPTLRATMPPAIPTSPACAEILPPAPPTAQAGSPPPASTPLPTPAADAVLASIRDWAQQASYPVFLPGYVPEGLTLSQNLAALSFDPGSGLQLSYVPTSPAPTFAPSAYAPPPPGFTIRERPADYNQLSARWGEGVTVTGGQGWLVRGMQNGAGATITILRDGTEVEINSFYIGADDVLSIANSLAPLPGGHAPITPPAPFTLAEIRAQLPIPVFIPTDLPVGLVAEPPTVYPQSFPGMGNFATPKYMVVTIIYHTSNGGIALMVRNGMADNGYSDPTHPDHPVLPNGVTADFINLPTSEGGPLLQWT